MSARMVEVLPAICLSKQGIERWGCLGASVKIAPQSLWSLEYRRFSGESGRKGMKLWQSVPLAPVVFSLSVLEHPPPSLSNFPPISASKDTRSGRRGQGLLREWVVRRLSLSLSLYTPLHVQLFKAGLLDKLCDVDFLVMHQWTPTKNDFPAKWAHSDAFWTISMSISSSHSYISSRL